LNYYKPNKKHVTVQCHHTLKAKLCASWTLLPSTYEQPTVHYGNFTPSKRAQGTHRMEIWVGLRISVDDPVQSNIPTIYGTLTVQPISSTMLTHLSWSININKPYKHNILNRLLPQKSSLYLKPALSGFLLFLIYQLM